MATVRSTAFHSLQARASKTGQVLDAAPRPSRIRFIVDVNGVGESRLIGNAALDFGALMLDEPSFSFGVIAASPIPYGGMPTATAIVLRYIQNSQDSYVGAEMGFNVQSLNQQIHLQFSLTFEGVTLRANVGTSTTQGSTSGGVNTYRGAS
jgi:hypothetical protein